jgi:tetratricopeptide (TPR) repeat protein
MKRVMTALFLATSLLLPFPAFAEIKTVTHTIKQPFGGSQPPDDARIAGIAKAKREALEQFGTYIESTTVVKNAQVDSDEILALTAGVTKAEVVKQKNYTDGDAFGIEITVRVELDTMVLENSLGKLLADRDHFKELKAARFREKELLARIVELEQENQRKEKTLQQTETLKKNFKSASQGLTAVDWFEKAIALWELKEGNPSLPAKAIEYLNQAIRLDPSFAKAYSTRGTTYYFRKQFILAIADFDQAIRFDPNIDIYLLRGISYDSLKQFDRAIADYTQVIYLDPKNEVAYYCRGCAYDSLNQFALAIADYTEAIRLNPKKTAAYYNRGLTNNRLMKFDRVIEDFTQVIKLNPNNSLAYVMRGSAYLMLGQDNRFCDDLVKACTLGECDSYKEALQKKFCK